MTITYGFHPSPFGECLIALIDDAICQLSFVDKGMRSSILAELSNKWPEFELLHNQEQTQSMVKRIFAKPTWFKLVCRGTDFQQKVWGALLKIKHGQTTTYQDIARRVKLPKAVRAVGTAIGANPIAYLIPCHRVTRNNGQLGGYRWGLHRKMAILASEKVSS